MLQIKFLSARCVGLLLSALCISLAHGKPPAEWKFEEWRDAVNKTQIEQKPLFVMFGFEDCVWCDHLYRRAMNDAELRAKYQNSVALTYFDTKSTKTDEPLLMPGGALRTRAEIIKQFQAYPTPSWVFISATGEVLSANRGGKSTAREMLRDLESALSKREARQ